VIGIRVIVMIAGDFRVFGFRYRDDDGSRARRTVMQGETKARPRRLGYGAST